MFIAMMLRTIDDFVVSVVHAFSFKICESTFSVILINIAFVQTQFRIEILVKQIGRYGASIRQFHSIDIIIADAATLLHAIFNRIDTNDFSAKLCTIPYNRATLSPQNLTIQQTVNDMHAKYQECDCHYIPRKQFFLEFFKADMLLETYCNANNDSQKHEPNLQHNKSPMRSFFYFQSAFFGFHDTVTDVPFSFSFCAAIRNGYDKLSSYFLKIIAHEKEKVNQNTPISR